MQAPIPFPEPGGAKPCPGQQWEAYPVLLRPGLAKDRIALAARSRLVALSGRQYLNIGHRQGQGGAPHAQPLFVQQGATQCHWLGAPEAGVSLPRRPNIACRHPDHPRRKGLVAGEQLGMEPRRAWTGIAWGLEWSRTAVQRCWRFLCRIRGYAGLRRDGGGISWIRVGRSATARLRLRQHCRATKKAQQTKHPDRHGGFPFSPEIAAISKSRMTRHPAVGPSEDSPDDVLSSRYRRRPMFPPYLRHCMGLGPESKSCSRGMERASGEQASLAPRPDTLMFSGSA